MVMTEVKKHFIDGLTAYYLKKGRNWWVESGENKESFDSIEAMVEKYPSFLDIEPIKLSVDRRAFSRTGDKPEVKLASLPKESIIEKKVECYYCNGTGIAGVLPCSNCNGTGSVNVTAKLS
jgi:RecJ-like exonuclease